MKVWGEGRAKLLIRKKDRKFPPSESSEDLLVGELVIIL